MNTFFFITSLSNYDLSLVQDITVNRHNIWQVVYFELPNSKTFISSKNHSLLEQSVIFTFKFSFKSKFENHQCLSKINVIEPTKDKKQNS